MGSSQKKRISRETASRGLREEFFSQFRLKDAERVLLKEKKRLCKDAEACGSTERQLKIQTLLHLPSPDVQNWNNTRQSYAAVRDAVRHRASLISGFKKEAVEKADLVGLTPRMKVRGAEIQLSDGRRIQADVRRVPPSIGHYYQSKLHYMLSPRADLVCEWGLFEEYCSYPLLYLGFAETDPRILRDLSYPRKPPLTLARAVSIVDLPWNAFSYTLAQVARQMRHPLEGVSGFVTAVNPYLGFTAASVMAAGFTPIATRPVAYWYNEYGSFTTRRCRTENSRRSSRQMPDNIQFYRPAGRWKQVDVSEKGVWHMSRVPGEVSVGELSSSEFRKSVERIAELERKRVVPHWGKGTKHPDFIGRSSDTSSAGQCGVTSVHVARRILHQIPGAMISYCYGDLLSSTERIKGIHRHCWLRVEMSGLELVVDCTPDQEGGIPGREVLVLTDEELGALGLIYEAKTVTTVDALVFDPVWPRYLKLADSLLGGK